MSATDTRCYAVRRLNPFLGVVEVVSSPSARALSTDGYNWQLQVLTERPEHTWASRNQFSSSKQFFRFGLWDPDNGMTRVPINPVLDVGMMLGAAEDLIARLPEALTELPFPLADRFELWQVDRARRPLALVATTHEERFIADIKAEQWHATLPASTPFISADSTARGVAIARRGSHRHHADLLEALVARATHEVSPTQWFERRADGSSRLTDSDDPTTLGAATFPVTAIRTSWDEPSEQALVDNYLDWLAPRLLMLPTLPVVLRRRLERAARSQSILVDQSFRLYPEVLDPDFVKAARVEAKLRQAAIA